MTDWDELATRVAETWGQDRKTGNPPGCSLMYIAAKTYWQAWNLSGFRWSLAEWFHEVEIRLPGDSPYLDYTLDIPEKK